MNILFSGIGGPTPLGLAKSIKQVWPNYNCIGIDASPWAPSLYQSDVFSKTIKVPGAGDKRYWESIHQLVQKEKIDFAFIVPETEVLVWSKYAKSNSLPCKTHIPDATLADFCFDKLSIAEILYPFGLSPKTLHINTAATGGQNPSEMNLPYPYWIRVKSGAGALGALKINSDKDLTTWLDIHAKRNDFIASEFLPGRNYACKLLYDQNKLVQAASAERIDYLLSAAAPSGISGMCGRGRLLNRNDLVQSSQQALEHVSRHLNVPLNGMFTVDFKEDTAGKPLVTEINIRHVSFTYAFALGGVNFAETTLRLYFDQQFSGGVSNHFKAEDYFIRGVDAPLRLVPAQEIMLN